MKSLFITITSIVTLLFFSSCEKKESKLIISQSPDNKLEISVSGVSYSSFDPWVVSISVNKVGDKEQIATVIQEIMAEEISKKSVNFDWMNNASCQIRFTQSDGSIIKVPVTVQL
jgi:hypothetical protein